MASNQVADPATPNRLPHLVDRPLLELGQLFRAHFHVRSGAMGHDGYQQNPAATEIPLAATGKRYDFARGQFYALDSNAVINTNQSAFSGAHSDIRRPEVLWAVACAAGLHG